MSSPIAKISKDFLRKFLISLHQKISHSNRISILSSEISDLILEISHKNEKIKCLDIGCGDMTLAENIEEKLNYSEWVCIDIHVLPEELKREDKWQKYRTFDGKNIPFHDHEFDVAIICDVLHHDMERASELIAEAGRVAKFVIIKDHFEYGFFSRKVLQSMDFIGNWAYGISIPNKYFRKSEFNKIVKEKKMNIERMSIGISLYGKLISIIAKPKFQFLSIITNS